jgi:hypothetical protein
MVWHGVAWCGMVWHGVWCRRASVQMNEDAARRAEAYTLLEAERLGRQQMVLADEVRDVT